MTAALVEVEHVGHATAHAGREVAAGRAEHDDAAAGHVLAAVVTDALDDRGRAGVADAEALAGLAAQEDLPGGGAVRDRVAGDDLLGGLERRRPVRAYDEPAAREPLADVVVGVALEPQRDPVRQERAERLAGRADQGEVDGAVGQALGRGSAW